MNNSDIAAILLEMGAQMDAEREAKEKRGIGKPRKKPSVSNPVHVAFADFETDPFKRDLLNPDPKTNPHGNRLNLHPFCVGMMFEDDEYWDYWGDDCADVFLDKLDTLTEPHIIYFHNGGKFDATFLQHRIPSQELTMIIHGRFVAFKYGIHEIRDSYSIFAQSLETASGKMKFDYKKMERELREEHKEEILYYLRDDCRRLKTLMCVFLKESPRKINANPFKQIPYTASSVAFSKLASFAADTGVSLDTMYTGQKAKPDPKKLAKQESRDIQLRPFFFGGRVQMFEHGVIEIDPSRPLRKYDVNSMYPFAMANFNHPLTDYTDRIPNPKLTPELWIETKPDCLYFVEFIGETVGVLNAFKEGRNSLDYRKGRIFMCSHEFRAGVELGYVKVERLINAFVWAHCDTGTFAPFVEHYYGKRQEQKQIKKAIAKQIFAMYEKANALGFGVTVIDDSGNVIVKTDVIAMRKGNDEARAMAGEIDALDYQATEANALDAFYKLLLNGSYGKTGFDYTNYRSNYWYNPIDDCAIVPDWAVSDPGKVVKDEDGETLGVIRVGDDTTLRKSFKGVFIAASITSAARAYLMRAIHGATRPIYCDTDSLICESLAPETVIDGNVLGAWKLELDNITECAIAGPKLYATLAINNGHRQIDVKAKGLFNVQYAEMVAVAKDPELVIQNYRESPAMAPGKSAASGFTDRKWRAILKAVPAGNIAHFRDVLKREPALIDEN
jgi:hypothetical protein